MQQDASARYLNRYIQPLWETVRQDEVIRTDAEALWIVASSIGFFETVSQNEILSYLAARIQRSYAWAEFFVDTWIVADDEDVFLDALAEAASALWSQRSSYTSYAYGYWLFDDTFGIDTETYLERFDQARDSDAAMLYALMDAPSAHYGKVLDRIDDADVSDWPFALRNERHRLLCQVGDDRACILHYDYDFFFDLYDNAGFKKSNGRRRSFGEDTDTRSLIPQPGDSLRPAKIPRFD